MWFLSLGLSVAVIAVMVVFWYVARNTEIAKKLRFNLFYALLIGVFLSSVIMFFPIHRVNSAEGILGVLHTVLLSIFNAMQTFAIGCEFAVVSESMGKCPETLSVVYQIWSSILFVFAPIFTFGFVLSLFKNLSAIIRYRLSYFKNAYIFSSLNDRSIALASDIKDKYPDSAIVFTDVFESNEEKTYELIEKARKLGAICFKKDISVINFKKHSSKKALSIFTINEDETENLNHAINLIESFKTRQNTHIYVFSSKKESELLLASIDRGNVKVRRINEIQSLVNRILYEDGHIIFDSARPDESGIKHISAVVVGMGGHGTEMVKALSWFGQMNGYSLEINAFDKDALAKDRFVALAPELMSDKYNGVTVEGEAQYKITVHSGVDVETATFSNEIAKITDTSYVLVALGDDDANISAAIALRMYFERMKIHPVIQAIVYNSQQKKALENIKNFKGQEYDIQFIGDMETSYSEKVIIDSDLEANALDRHLKWGKEEEFWAYEYNYRSSMASAIHMKARIDCGIPGADKKEDELTLEERDIIEVLEHRRWNAYMRSEGYVYSGSNDKSSRNDLAKMHHDLVDFSSLTEEEKRKDSKVGSN